MSMLDAVEMRTSSCDEHGDYESKLYRWGSAEHWSGCPRCFDQQRRRDLLALSRKVSDELAERRRLARWEAAAIPERFREATLENYQPATERAGRIHEVCRSYALKWRELLKQGTSMVFMGKPGTGKTHLAIGVLRAVLEAGSSGRYVNFADMMLEIRSVYGVKGKSELPILERYIEPDLLVLDELGVTSGSDHEKQMVFHILNKRYEARRPTIVLSNLEDNELREFLGQRVWDRLRDNGGKGLAFDWDSFRG